DAADRGPAGVAADPRRRRRAVAPPRVGRHPGGPAVAGGGRLGIDADRLDAGAGSGPVPPARRVTGAAPAARVAWIDAHCHLQFEDRGPTPEEAVARAVDSGVERMVCIGTDLATSREAVRLAGMFPELWATVGLHPHDASKLAGEWDRLVDLVSAERVVGIRGEPDAPFLAPVPHRGKTNDPAFLPAVGAALAAARAEPVVVVAAATRANTLAFCWPSSTPE